MGREEGVYGSDWSLDGQAKRWRMYAQLRLQSPVIAANLVSALGLEPRTHALKVRFGDYCTRLHSVA